MPSQSCSLSLLQWGHMCDLRVYFSREHSSPQISILQRKIQDQSKFYIPRSPTYIHTLSCTFTISSFVGLPFIFNNNKLSVTQLFSEHTGLWLLTLTKHPQQTASSHTYRHYPLMMPHISPCKSIISIPSPHILHQFRDFHSLESWSILSTPMPPDSQRALPKMLLRILLCDRVVISKFRPTLARLR